ncbi:hypothetical protein FOZ61_000966, partial [Perkinsus olseni]
NTIVRGEVRIISLSDEYDGPITLMMAAEKEEGYYHHHVLASTSNKRTERWVKLDKLGIILPTSPVDGGGGGVGDNTLPDEHYVNDLVEEANITQRFSRTYHTHRRTSRWVVVLRLDGGEVYQEEEEEVEGATAPTTMQYMVVGTSSPPASWCMAYLHHACQEAELEVNKMTIECEMAKCVRAMAALRNRHQQLGTTLEQVKLHRGPRHSGYREDRARLRDQMSNIERKMHDGRAEFDTLKGKREKCITGLRRLKYIIHEYKGPLLEAYLQHTSSLPVNADHGDGEQGRYGIMLSRDAPTRAVTALPALDPHYDVTPLYDDIDDDHHQDDDGSIGEKPLDPSPDPTRDEEEEVHSTTNPTTPAAVGADFSIVGKWRSQYANNIEVKEDGMVTMTILGREIRATLLKEEEQQQEQQGLLLDDAPHLVTPDDNTVIPSSSNDNHHHHEDGLTSSLLGHGDDGLTRPARPRTRPFASSLEIIFHTQNTQWPPPSQENDDVASDVTEMERDAPLSSSSSSQRQYDDDDVWTPPSNWNRALDELDGILTSVDNDLGYVVHISQLLMDILQQHYYYHSNVNEHDNSAIARNNEVVHIDKTMVLVVEGDDRVSDPTGEMPAILPTRIREHTTITTTTTTRRPVIIIHYANIVIKDSSHIILVIDMDAVITVIHDHPTTTTTAAAGGGAQDEVDEPWM